MKFSSYAVLKIVIIFLIAILLPPYITPSAFEITQLSSNLLSLVTSLTVSLFASTTIYHFIHLRFRSWLSKPVSTPPAHKLVCLLKFLFTKKSYESVFEQAIFNMRDEHYEALQDKKKWLALWRRFQIYPILFSTIFMFIGAKTAKKFIELWKAI